MRRVWLMGALALIVLFQNVNGKRIKRIVGGSPAQVPPPYQRSTTSPTTSTTTTTTTQSPTTTAPLVYVKREKRTARVSGVVNPDNSMSFLGIRYAEPPVGRLRFQRPRRLKLKGDIRATNYGPPCPQYSPFQPGKIIGSEDCLFLNVFTPQRAENSKFPVLFWIHGGNFRSGSGAQYFPRHLIRKGIAVVTTNYRLGSLGFLSTGRRDLPGNAGLFDVSLALRWVKEYIRYFGGDPNQIVVAGQGSGASVASLLALNRFNQGRVRGVLAMSGSPVSPFALDHNENRTANEVSLEDGCKVDDGDEFVRCMQDLPLETVMKGDTSVENKRKTKEEFPKGLANLQGPGPAEEGKEDDRFLPHFIVESPFESMQKGVFPNIPLMTGVTKEETGAGVKGNFFKTVASKILSPSFLKSGLFQDALHANTGLYVNKTVNPNLSSLFLNNKYLEFFTSILSSALSDMEKVVKHTTDAFFNLPAFVTSHLWSKKNKVFLYSFEHKPKKSTAFQFLPNIPTVSSKETPEKKGPEHGDDLAYLFDIRSLEGNQIENGTELDAADSKVKEDFTTSVAEFARSGSPKIEGTTWSPFSAENGDYMIISEESKPAKNFHKCEMGLWTGDQGILGSPQCSVLNQAANIAKNTLGSAQSALLGSVSTFESNVNKLKETLTPTGLLKPVSVRGGLGILGRGEDRAETSTKSNKRGGLFGGFQG